MIRYARRKKKKDMFVLWLGLSTMGFGIAGATLRGVSAVRSVPFLTDSEPAAITVSLVTAEETGGVAEIATEAKAEPIAAVKETISPFDAAHPFDLPAPEPLLANEVDALELDDANPSKEISKKLPAIETEPDPVTELDTPPEPEPIPTKPMEEIAEAPVAEELPKVEKTPPSPPKREVAKKPTTKKKATPPKPAPRAQPTRSGPNVVVQKPKVLYRPNLRFPDEAKRKGIGGSLDLDVRVGTNGRVTSVKIVRSSGHKMLDAEAISAVRAWRFEPAKNSSGKALSHTIRVPVNFGYAAGR